MSRILLVALAALALVPAAAEARPGEPFTDFGRRGTVTLKATSNDAVGSAVKVVSGNRVLAGGAAAGQFVIVKLRSSGSLDSTFGTSGQVVPALPGVDDGRRARARNVPRRPDPRRRDAHRRGRHHAHGGVAPAARAARSTRASAPGSGYLLVGPVNAELAAMTMDRDGNVILGGGRPAGPGAEAPIVIRLLPDGTADPAFGSNGSVDGAALGLSGRATSLLVRSEGTITFTVGAGPENVGNATFNTVRLLATGAPDTTFGGTGVVSVPLGPGAGTGIGAFAVSRGPSTTTLVAGTDLTNSGTPRGSVLRLRADGTLDTRFGSSGIVHVARAGRDIRITSMVRDNRARILLAGTGQPPDSLIVRLRVGGSRDTSFGNGGLTYPVLGNPPGGEPVFTTFNAIDVAGTRAVIVGSSAGPGALVRSPNGVAFRGRFALTVSKLQ